MEVSWLGLNRTYVHQAKYAIYAQRVIGLPETFANEFMEIIVVYAVLSKIMGICWSILKILSTAGCRRNLQLIDH